MDCDILFFHIVIFDSKGLKILCVCGGVTSKTEIFFYNRVHSSVCDSLFLNLRLALSAS